MLLHISKRPPVRNILRVRKKGSDILKRRFVRINKSALKPCRKIAIGKKEIWRGISVGRLSLSLNWQIEMWQTFIVSKIKSCWFRLSYELLTRWIAVLLTFHQICYEFSKYRSMSYFRKNIEFVNFIYSLIYFESYLNK